jgi:hypothetical protein
MKYLISLSQGSHFSRAAALEHIWAHIPLLQDMEIDDSDIKLKYEFKPIQFRV